MFEVRTSPKRYVMAIVPCTAAGVTLGANTKFVALDGTRTFAVQMRDVVIPDAYVIADPVDDYIKRIRAGFVLLQAGMAIGLIRDCIGLMQQTKGSLGHVNKYLDIQPEHLAARLEAMERAVARLAVTPFETDPAYWRAVIEARLAPAKRRSWPHTPPCSIAARAAMSPRAPRSAVCAKPISSPSSRRRPSNSKRCSPTWRTEKGEGKNFLPGTLVKHATQEPNMSEKVLVTPAELSSMMQREPIVVIDTRNPATYVAGHIPGAVNIHDIFTYLATSTPDGVAAMRSKFADIFGAAGLSGKETAVVYEQSMNTGFGQSCRGYVLLRYLGYPKVKIVHGGYAAWARRVCRQPRKFPCRARPNSRSIRPR